MFGLFNKHKIAIEVPGEDESRAPQIKWQSILSKADANDDQSISAVTALNVKVICELAPLVRDRAKYERYQHEALDLALSIRDEPYRSFAMKQVEGLSRRGKNTCSPLPNFGRNFAQRMMQNSGR